MAVITEGHSSYELRKKTIEAMFPCAALIDPLNSSPVRLHLSSLNELSSDSV